MNWSTIGPNHKLYEMALALKAKGIFMVGTIRSNRMGGCDLESGATLKKSGRGSHSAATEMKTGINLIRLYDKKAINFILHEF